MDKPGFFDGLDLVRERSGGLGLTSAREDEVCTGAGDLNSADEDGSENCEEEAEERASYAL